MQGAAEGFGELLVGERIRRRAVQRTRGPGIVQGKQDNPYQVGMMDPAHPLLARSHRTAGKQFERRDHLAKRSPFPVQDDTDPHSDHA